MMLDGGKKLVLAVGVERHAISRRMTKDRPAR